MSHYLWQCKFIFCVTLSLLQVGNNISSTNCEAIDSTITTTNEDDLVDNFMLDNEEEMRISKMIDAILTPSDECKEIVAKFASAISNFTLCSVTNSRPIHLCGWCIGSYLSVVKSYHDFFVTVDKKGNPCKEYFTNLDRVEIVTEAYKYVKNLWTKGSCDYCFKKYTNGSIEPEVTDDVSDFLLLYELTKSCFKSHVKDNATCTDCKFDYQKLNNFYIDLVAKYRDNVCLDLIDTMNITREIWSDVYHCTPPRQGEILLHVCMGLVALTPIIFYIVAYLSATKQEARVVHQRRLAEMFTATSISGITDMSGYHSSRLGRSTTISSTAPSTSAGCQNPQELIS